MTEIEKLSAERERLVKRMDRNITWIAILCIFLIVFLLFLAWYTRPGKPVPPVKTEQIKISF